jgi:hypothetical protein
VNGKKGGGKDLGFGLGWRYAEQVEGLEDVWLFIGGEDYPELEELDVETDDDDDDDDGVDDVEDEQEGQGSEIKVENAAADDDDDDDDADFGRVSGGGDVNQDDVRMAGGGDYCSKRCEETESMLNNKGGSALAKEDGDDDGDDDDDMVQGRSVEDDQYSRVLNREDSKMDSESMSPKSDDDASKQQSSTTTTTTTTIETSTTTTATTHTLSSFRLKYGELRDPSLVLLEKSAEKPVAEAPNSSTNDNNNSNSSSNNNKNEVTIMKTSFWDRDLDAEAEIESNDQQQKSTESTPSANLDSTTTVDTCTLGFFDKNTSKDPPPPHCHLTSSPIPEPPSFNKGPKRHRHLPAPTLKLLEHHPLNSIHYGLTLMLSICTNLKNLKLHLPPPTDIDTIGLKLFHLPNLRSLDLAHKFTDEQCRMLLEGLVFPFRSTEPKTNAKKVNGNGNGNDVNDDDDDDSRSRSGFVSRRHKNLKVLLLRRPELSDVAISEWLPHAFENLETLILPSTPPPPKPALTRSSRRNQHQHQSSSSTWGRWKPVTFSYEGAARMLSLFPRTLKVLDISAASASASASVSTAVSSENNNNNNNNSDNNNNSPNILLLPPASTQQLLLSLQSHNTHLRSLTVSLSAKELTIPHLTMYVLPHLRGCLEVLVIKPAYQGQGYTGDSTVEEEELFEIPRACFGGDDSGGINGGGGSSSGGDSCELSIARSGVGMGVGVVGVGSGVCKLKRIEVVGIDFVSSYDGFRRYFGCSADGYVDELKARFKRKWGNNNWGGGGIMGGGGGGGGIMGNGNGVELIVRRDD